MQSLHFYFACIGSAKQTTFALAGWNDAQLL